MKLVGFHGWPRTLEGLNQRCEMVERTFMRTGCNRENTDLKKDIDKQAYWLYVISGMMYSNTSI
jgi:hypothetical protein